MTGLFRGGGFRRYEQQPKRNFSPRKRAGEKRTGTKSPEKEAAAPPPKPIVSKVPGQRRVRAERRTRKRTSSFL